MNNLKGLFFILAIILIATTFFVSISTAAEVTRIHSTRKYVYINGSIADGFVMGARVCFYSSSGDEITCGPIDQASESLVRVRVNNRIAKKIRYGMEAKLSPEKNVKKEVTEPKACTGDSECNENEFCIYGKCQKR